MITIACLSSPAFVSCGTLFSSKKAPEEPMIVHRQESRSTSDSDHLLNIINAHRKQKGVPELIVDKRLEGAARDHSISMARHQYLKHKGKDGRLPQERIRRHGYPMRRSAENLAMSSTAESVFRLWYNSKGHRVNMMQGKYSHVGIARSGRYWSAVFAATDGSQ